MNLNRASFIVTIALIVLFLQSSHCFVPPTLGRIYDQKFTKSTSWAATDDIDQARETLKNDLLDLLKETPSNAPTSKKLTNDILEKIDDLEKNCPTPDELVLPNLSGNWELLWTAQDKRSTEWKRNPLRAFIK